MVPWCVLCLRDSGDCLVVVLTSLHRLSTSFRNGSVMVSKLRGGVLGSRARSELKESWQTRSQLMGERNGCATSVLSQTCGRGGVAGGVTVTSPRCCKGRTDRPSLQSQENGPQALQRRVERRTEKLGVGLMPESATFWVNASRAIPLLTFTDVNNNSIFIFFLVLKKL